jgi:hypothetical protein
MARGTMPTERRKNPRLGLAIPLRVQGFLADGATWEEMTITYDVSWGGACFPLGREAELGQVLLLTLALPKRLRQYDLTDASYRVYTLVRSVRRRADQVRVGVMFFGKQPPRGFAERPGARFLLPTDSIVNAPAPQGLRAGDETPTGGAAPAGHGYPPPETMVGAGGTGASRGFPADDSGSRYTPPPMTAASTIPKRKAQAMDDGPPAPSATPFQATSEVPQDRRSNRRSEVFVNFTIQLVDEWGVVLQEELTVADNLSRGGARVMTTLTFQVGDILLLQEAGGGFATRAEVRGISRAQPTIDRLHLSFLDRQAPDRMLRQ